MIFIDFQSAPALLILTEPDWAAGEVSVRLSAPSDVATSLHARESRRAFSRSLRFTISYPVTTLSTQETTAFRQALNRLKVEPVLCPLWTDAVETASDLGPGTTTVPFAPVPGAAARFGSTWIVLNEASAAYELVQVSTQGAASLTLTGGGLVNAWPAGTRIYPVLFGRFASRPELQAITAHQARGTLTVTEDSDMTRAVWPVTITPALVGAAVPEMAALPLWGVPPDWIEPSDRTEADILEREIGFLRSTQRQAYQQAVRRVMDLEFHQAGRAQIALIESFWLDRRGPVKPFAAPTWRSDLKLAADLPLAPANTVDFTASAWTDPSYAAHPGAPFLALVGPDFSVEPIRVTLIGVGVITLFANVAGAHLAADTLVSHLLLCRFNDPVLTWTYLGPARAKTKLTFLEVSGEYAAAIPDLPEPAFLYRFTSTLPNGTVRTWSYTSYEAPLTVGGTTHAPAPFSHGELKSSLRLDKEEVDLTSFDFAGNPLRQLLPFSLEAPLVLTISEADVRDLTVTPVVLFSGEVWDLEPKGKEFKSKCLAFGRVFERKFPRILLQPQCNKSMYSPPCGLNPADWRVATTVASVDASGLTVALNGDGQALGRFAGGWLETGAGAAYQSRTILSSTASAGGQFTITLNRPLATGFVAGTAVGVFPMCGQTSAGCRAFNNFDNFLGFEFVPAQNPAVQAVPSENPSGGKGGGGGK